MQYKLQYKLHCDKKVFSAGSVYSLQTVFNRMLYD